MTTTPTEAAAPAGRPPVKRAGFLRILLRRPAVVVAMAVLVLVVAAAVLAPWVAPYGPDEQNLLAAQQGPSGAHWLGTGPLGLDELSRVMWGGRVTLVAVVVAVVVYLLVGAPLGMVAGYRGGRFDWFVLKAADIAFAVPGIIVTLAVVSVFPRNEIAAMIGFGLLGAPALARIVRSATLGIREELYVRAAVAAGLTDSVIIRRHILPKVLGVILVHASLFAATAVLMETGLGFLGVGSSKASWGVLVGEASQSIALNPWLLVPSGGIIVLFVLALTTTSDGIRDALQESQSAAVVRVARRSSIAARVPTVVGTSELGPPSPSALISVRGLNVSLPIDGLLTAVVQGVSFDVAPGEAFGIVGESGCGKSITASALVGMLPKGGEVTSGSIMFDGEDIAHASNAVLRKLRGSRVGWISQDPISSLDPAFTAGAQVADVVRLQTGCTRKEARRRALELLELVRLRDPERVARSYPHQLSGGMAQRVGIACALAGQPDVIIADEPTTALDVTVQAEILDILRDLQRGGTAIVLITHNWGVLADLCQRAIVMYAGEVVEIASVEEIVHDPAHPYSTALLTSSPHRGVRGQLLPALDGSVPPPQRWPLGCHFQDRCVFATEECAAGPIRMAPVPGAGRLARCLRLETVRAVTGSSHESV